MKPSLFQRLSARLTVSRHKKKQGVAILTVLAIITLMTVLVVSFFNMAQTSKTTAKGSVEIQRVTTLRDTIINLVIAQFREASNLTPRSGSNPRDIITWISQPGAIRTFSSTPGDSTKNKLYKLYSSSVPQIESIAPFATEDLLQQINNDNASDWAERPDEFTDLNRPVYTAATGDRAQATAATDSTGYSFPIVDPRGYNGKSGTNDMERNVEGFSYGSTSITKSIQGVDPSKEQLAMPVRWIYLLQDGTLGYLDSQQEFRPLNGSSSGEATRENPIVGRLAWWADDESSKINVNTASIPAAWDTPRTNSKEDQWLAQNQPIAGEYQRYPGHPATVDLSAVFYPNRRWVPPGLASILQNDRNPAGGKMDLLPYEDAARVWDLAPFIVGKTGEVRNGSVGTGGGNFPTPSDASTGASTDDRLFTSMDEVYFKASGAINKSLNAPRSNLLSENQDANGRFQTKLEQAQFFLTHKSHSPELTNQGFPRVSMFPMDTRAVAELGKTSGNLPEGVSPFDITVALNSTIGGKSTIPGGNAYFFQRLDPGSRHNEFYNGSDSRQRNTRIFAYLKELSKLPIPGYPEQTPYKVQSTSSEDPLGLSLASKYPPGLSGRGTVYGSNGGASALADSSERTQILLNMLDFTRSINMQPAFLSASAKYDDGWGKSVGVCGCANAAGVDTNATHATALAYTNQTTRSPKGTGKLYGAAEIAIVVNVAGMKASAADDEPAQGAWGLLFGTMSTQSQNRARDKSKPGQRFIVEVGVVVSAFNPKHGWAASMPIGGVAISGAAQGGSNKVFSNENSPLPMYGPDSEPIVAANVNYQVGANTSHQMPKNAPTATQGVIPLGGMGGPRVYFPPTGNTKSFAITKPFCVIGNNSSAVDPQLVVDTTQPLRVVMMDGSEEYDAYQAIDLALPSDFFQGIQASFTGDSLARLVNKYATGALPFPDGKTYVRSFVVPHGDYRLTTTPGRVDADVFVPHQDYATQKIAHSFFEMNSVPANRTLVQSTWNPEGMFSRTLVPNLPLVTSGASNLTNVPVLPLPLPKQNLMGITALGAVPFLPVDQKILEQASSINPARAAMFAHGRRDGRGVIPNRGSSDPMETGDFDTGVAAAPDGPYMNYPDEGDRRRNMQDAYFRGLYRSAQKPNSEGIGGQNISPNFLVRSPVDFGSIPTGVASRVPWQTLRFRPDIGMNDPAKKMSDINDVPPRGMPFANFCGPKDHFFLDMFWMPVVEPWSISEPFSTKGTINLNQQILPFMYIERTTALHALLRGERMYAIPNASADKYKRVDATGFPQGEEFSYRHFINARETVRQFTNRYKNGRDSDNDPPGGNTLGFNVFRSASEICEIWLVPENPDAASSKNTLEWTVGRARSNGTVDGFWGEHQLTGDNLRERPYANLYPRVTVRSNVFKLHMVAQTLQKAKSQDPKKFDSVQDTVTAEWRGSCMIERSIDPRDSKLTNLDYTKLDSKNVSQTTTPKLDRFYTYRVTEVKQLTQ